MNQILVKFHIFICLFILSFSSDTLADNEMLIISGFRVTHELILPGEPNQVYDAITGDISGWWDHSFSEKLVVHTYKFTAVGPDSTKLNLTVNAIGEVNKKLAEVVDKVWYHFLFEQFEPYMKSLIAADKE